MKYFVLFLVLFGSLEVFAGKDFPEDLFPPLSLNLEEVTKNSDDPFQYPTDFTPNHIKISELSWVTTKHLPFPIETQRSNNNMSITVFQNRLFMAFRTSFTHFASKKTHLYVMSSLDGVHWDFELDVFERTDLREPQLAVFNNKLYFMFFKGGSNPFEFKPENMQRLERKEIGHWAAPELILQKGEVPWEIKTRKDKSYLTSYKGSHYNLSGESKVDVYFQETTNGKDFTGNIVYQGGVSEVGWEFDHEGNIWAVTRNEDGDKNGFGSQILKNWKQVGATDPNCYMSPKMFRVGKELYLIGRKQLGPVPFDRTDADSSWTYRRLNNWIRHSLTPKGTALYRINKESAKIEFVMDLPGHGDTAFPSIYRLNEKEILVANYSSSLAAPGRSWIVGQLRATHIYLLKLTFD